MNNYKKTLNYKSNYDMISNVPKSTTPSSAELEY